MTRSPGWRSGWCRRTNWVDPVTGALDVPGWGRVPPTPFYRAEHGVFACRRLGGRAMLITLELDRSAREERIDGYDDDDERTAIGLARDKASVKRVLQGRRTPAADRLTPSWICVASTASTRGSPRGTSRVG